jgi:hypothetical protein
MDIKEFNRPLSDDERQLLEAELKINPFMGVFSECPVHLRPLLARHLYQRTKRVKNEHDCIDTGAGK